MPGDKDVLYLRMIHDILVIRFADGRIDRDMDGSHLLNRHVHEVPFSTVRADLRDRVTPLYP